MAEGDSLIPKGIERIGIGSGAVATALLALSVFFDFNFLYALGLRFSEVPTGIADHVRSAIIWVPPFAVMAGTIIMGRLLVESVPLPKTGSPARRLTTLSFAAGLLVVIVYTAFVSPRRAHWFVIAIFVWCWIAFSVPWREWLGRPLGRTAGVLTVLLPSFVLMVGYFGYSAGEAALTTKIVRWDLVIRDGTGQRRVQLAAIRRFHDGTVLVDMEGRVSVVPTSDVLYATSLTPTHRGEHLGCYLFGAGCP